MGTIHKNLARIAELEEIIERHLAGGELTTTRGRIRYDFFEMWQGLGGIQVSLDKGRINALTLLIKKLDEIYNSAFSWSSNHTNIKSI